jgi:prolyl-tRNA editing enzyme YbaK/EbsC (Cys-tRNA(Pro) deacylase)
VADATERFAVAARSLGFEPEIGRFPDGTRTAADAAAAVGCELSQIVKSLVFAAGEQPVLVLTAGSNRVDERLVAAALGVDHVGKADAAMVRSATGFAIGGTPPFGHVGELITLVDVDLFDHDVVWAAAGTPDSCFPIAPERLAALAGARRVRVAG